MKLNNVTSIVYQFPFGRGAGLRPLIPFKSVAIDPRLVPLGEPLYIPEFDGLLLPDGSLHDGWIILPSVRPSRN